MTQLTFPRGANVGAVRVLFGVIGQEAVTHLIRSSLPIKGGRGLVRSCEVTIGSDHVPSLDDYGVRKSAHEPHMPSSSQI